MTAEEDEAAVRAAYESYRKAALSRKGTEAAEVMASSAIDYYEQVRKDALTAPYAQLKGKRLIDALAVLSMRAEFDARTLQRLNGREVLVASLNKGLVNDKSLLKMSLGDIAIEGDRAVAQLRLNGKPQPVDFEFVREDGRWKLDLLDLLNTVNPAVVAAAKQAKVSREQFIQLALESQYGAAKAAKLRRPLLRQ